MSGFVGLWRNQEGSRLFIAATAPELVGFYETRVGKAEAMGKRHAIFGVAHGDLIGWSVAWTDAASLTTWSGRLIERPERPPVIRTLWHLARATKGDPPEPTGAWETFLSNASEFERIGSSPP